MANVCRTYQLIAGKLTCRDRECRFRNGMKGDWDMPGAIFQKTFAVVVCLSMAGCATAPTENRARIIDVPLASDYSDIAFTVTSSARQGVSCTLNINCQTLSDRDAALRFALQVEWIAAVLQDGARQRYPDLTQRAPTLSGSRFDVYVVEGDAPGSASSANGRIALNATLGAWGPYDDWLAFVIAREMGHVIARHHEENSSSSIVTSVIMKLLIPVSGWLKSVLTAGGSRAAAISKRDIQAQEADAIALELLKAAGYRLHDVSLALRAAPALPDDDQWSRSFRKSSDRLMAEVQRTEFAIASVTLQPQSRQSPDMASAK